MRAVGAVADFVIICDCERKSSYIDIFWGPRCECLCKLRELFHLTLSLALTNLLF